jgi:N,N'-diacetyllegionaminate synthase
MEVKIGNRELKTGGEPFIVAEVGINHNGELSKALEMIEVAKEAGVDAVKFQTFKASEFVSDAEQMFTYSSQGKQVTESMLAMFSRYELRIEDWAKIKEKCERENILFLSTPQNYSDLELLLKIGIPAIKVGSDDFTNIPLLKQYSTIGLPMIISSGMADLSEVFNALDAVNFSAGSPTILLICTSQYPTPIEDVNLLKLETLRSIFPRLTLGFSDHTQGFLAASLAVALGACFFEKHFTLDTNLPGPDHWFSENPSA